MVLCTNGSRLPPREVRERLERNGVAVAPRARSPTRARRRPCARGRLRDPANALAPRRSSSRTGQHPQCDLAVQLGCAFNQKGTVKTGMLGNTNVPGVFVAGDASRDAQFVVVAAAEGVKAAVAINQALQARELRP